MPDGIWVSYFKPFDYPESCDSPWGVYRNNPKQSDSEMTTWGSYIRKDLVVRKSELRKLVDLWNRNIENSLNQDVSRGYRNCMLDLLGLINNVVDLTGETEND